MIARFALAIITLAAVGPVQAAPTVDEVASLIHAKLACHTRDTADGFTVSMTADQGGKLSSTSHVLIDRKHRRMLSRTRTWVTLAPERTKLVVYAFDGETGYGCTAAANESCTPTPLPPAKPLDAQAAITSRYMSFRDFLTPDRGKAFLELAEGEPDIEGATWHLKVTPEGGLPIVMHAAVDGTMIAMDVAYPDGSRVRTSYAERVMFEDCLTASSMRQTTHPKDTGYVQQTVTGMEIKASMTPADTPVDQPVSAP